MKSKDCFNKNETLSTIAIPSSIISIENNAFFECSQLTQIIIPSSVKSIGDYCFKSCSSLSKITIPLSVASIGNYAFCECTELKHVSFSQSSAPSSLRIIGDYSFARCSSLQHFVIPFSVTTIGNGSFSGCSSLEQISIPPTVASIGSYAFCECTELKHVSFSESLAPSSLRMIGDYSFTRCSSLQHFVIPFSVTTIGNGSFSGCSSLEQISIPPTVTSIENSTFSGCFKLAEIEIPPTVTSIGNCAFSECMKLAKIEIPSSVTSIGNCVFLKCTSLTKMSIPSSVTNIGALAFAGCSSLTDLSIPSSTTDIGTFAFYGCTSLKEQNSDLFKSYVFASIDDYEIKGKNEFFCYRDIFIAVNKETGQEVLLKCYEEDDYNDEIELIERVFASRIPGIVPIYNIYIISPEDESKNAGVLKNMLKNNDIKYVIFTEYYKNNDVKEIKQKYLSNEGNADGKLNPTIRSKIVFGIASIMKRLHKMNVIHRNLTFSNIFLDENDEPVLDTFCLTKFLTNPSNLIRFAGTPFYMAPELFETGEGIYGLSSDVYAYGTLLYMMFTNKILLEGKQPSNIQQFKNEVKSGKRFRRLDNIPDHYWELIMRCWKQNPGDRPTFEEIVNILKDDKFAFEEFGMKTDLEQLHEYQRRIDTD